MADKTFVGRVETVSGKFGDFYKIGISEKDITTLQDNLNAKGWVNLVLMTNKSGRPYICVDTYEPKTQSEPVQDVQEIDMEDIPF